MKLYLSTLYAIVCLLYGSGGTRCAFPCTHALWAAPHHHGRFDGLAASAMYGVVHLYHRRHGQRITGACCLFILLAQLAQRFHQKALLHRSSDSPRCYLFRAVCTASASENTLWSSMAHVHALHPLFAPAVCSQSLCSVCWRLKAFLKALISCQRHHENVYR